MPASFFLLPLHFINEILHFPLSQTIHRHDAFLSPGSSQELEYSHVPRGWVVCSSTFGCRPSRYDYLFFYLLSPPHPQATPPNKIFTAVWKDIYFCEKKDGPFDKRRNASCIPFSICWGDFLLLPCFSCTSFCDRLFAAPLHIFTSTFVGLREGENNLTPTKRCLWAAHILISFTCICHFA